MQKKVREAPPKTSQELRTLSTDCYELSQVPRITPLGCSLMEVHGYVGRYVFLGQLMFSVTRRSRSDVSLSVCVSVLVSRKD